MKTQGDREVPKKKESVFLDFELVVKNYRAINLLYCGLDPDEFNIIKYCKKCKRDLR